MLKALFFVIISGIISCTSIFASEVKNKPFHNNLKCEQCHKNQINGQFSANNCIVCHGTGEELSEKMKGQFLNPHNSPHWGTTVECTVCHREHQASRLICANCHPKMKSNMK